MRSVVRKTMVTCIAFGSALMATNAFGDETAKIEDQGDGDYMYEFLDDPLAARGVVPGGGSISVPQRSVRTLLIRPRTQFITQMLKSVEQL